MKEKKDSLYRLLISTGREETAARIERMLKPWGFTANTDDLPSMEKQYTVKLTTIRYNIWLTGKAIILFGIVQTFGAANIDFELENFFPVENDDKPQGREPHDKDQ